MDEQRTFIGLVLLREVEEPLGYVLEFAREILEVLLVDVGGVEEREKVLFEARISEQKTEVLLGYVPEEGIAILDWLIEVADVAIEFESSLFEVPLVKLVILPGHFGQFLHQQLEDELQVFLIPLDGGKKLTLLEESEEVERSVELVLLYREHVSSLLLNDLYNNVFLDFTNF